VIRPVSAAKEIPKSVSQTPTTAADFAKDLGLRLMPAAASFIFLNFVPSQLR